MDNESNLIFEQYKSLNEMSGLNRAMGKMVNVPGPGSQNTASKVVVMKIGDKEGLADCEDAEKEEETVFIKLVIKMSVKVIAIVTTAIMIMMVN